jgi:hypothetical protein
VSLLICILICNQLNAGGKSLPLQYLESPVGFRIHVPSVPRGQWCAHVPACCKYGGTTTPQQRCKNIPAWQIQPLSIPAWGAVHIANFFRLSVSPKQHIGPQRVRVGSCWHLLHCTVRPSTMAPPGTSSPATLSIPRYHYLSTKQ